MKWEYRDIFRALRHLDIRVNSFLVMEKVYTLVEYERFKSTELEPWNIYNAQRRSHNVQTDDEGDIET